MKRRPSRKLARSYGWNKKKGMRSKSSTTVRPVKMSDIAQIAGVSASTVSRALADHPGIPEATRKTIRSIADEHGYVINRSARSLRQSQTKTIAVLSPMGHEKEQLVSDPFFLRLFGYLADEISARGYDILLIREPSPDSLWLRRLMQSQRADGFIIIGQSDQHEALNLAAQSLPQMVVFGAQLPDEKYCSVGSDNAQGGWLATDYLLRCGRRRIMFVGPAELPEIRLRLSGYLSALANHGIQADPRLILPAHFIGRSAYDQTQKMIAQGVAFDGVFGASDGIALSAVRAIEEAGLRCPEDISVVGFDDSDVASQARPALTTVKQYVPTIAKALVERLFSRMEGQEAPSQILPVELIIRESA